MSMSTAWQLSPKPVEAMIFSKTKNAVFDAKKAALKKQFNKKNMKNLMKFQYQLTLTINKDT